MGPGRDDGDSVWFCGAAWGTNNTGEIIGIEHALMWLRNADDEVDTPIGMMSKSHYATD
jgi:hypothetical protein